MERLCEFPDCTLKLTSLNYKCQRCGKQFCDNCQVALYVKDGSCYLCSSMRSTKFVSSSKFEPYVFASDPKDGKSTVIPKLSNIKKKE